MVGNSDYQLSIFNYQLKQRFHTIIDILEQEKRKLQKLLKKQTSKSKSK